MFHFALFLWLEFANSAYTDPITQCTFTDSSLQILKTVPIGKKHLTFPESVIEIADGSDSTGAFFECRNEIKSIEFNSKLEKIGSYAFQYCSFITELVFPSSLKTLSDSSFSNMINLKSVTFPMDSNLNFIGVQSFQYCFSLENIVLPMNGNLKTISFAAFEVCSKIREIVIPDSVTYIDRYVFTHCSSLERAVLPSNTAVTAVMNQTFFKCSSLTEVSIGKYVKTVLMEAFSGCSSLVSINVPDDNIYLETASKDPNSVNFGVLLQKNDGNNGKSIILFPPGKKNEFYKIDDDIIRISDTAFNSCNYLKRIILGSSVSIIESNAFSKSQNIEIFDTNSNPHFIFENMVLYNEIKTVIYAVAPKHQLAITTVTIPNTVNIILESAFNYCHNIENVIFETGSKIAKIDNSVFLSCTNLKTINIPATVSTIGWYAFQLNSHLETVTFDVNSELKEIYGAAFESCTSLKSIIIPTGTLHLYNAIFSECRSLVSIDLPDSINYMNGNNFQYCSSLKSVKLPSKLTTIPIASFQFCSNLTSVTFPLALEEIKSSAFYNCLSYVPKLPDTITTIGSLAFQNCLSIKEFRVPENAKSIEAEAFNGCENLITVLIPEKLEEIRNTAFYYCDNLLEFKLIEYEGGRTNERFSVEDGVLYSKDKTILYNYPPGKRKELFVVPEQVKVINFVSFYGAKKVTEINLSKVEDIRYNAFGNTNFKCKGVIFEHNNFITKEKLIEAGVKREMIEECPPTVVFTTESRIYHSLKHYIFSFFLLSILEA